MFILVIGTLWYVSADRECVEKEQNKAYRESKHLDFKNDEDKSLLLNEDELEQTTQTETVVQ